MRLRIYEQLVAMPSVSHFNACCGHRDVVLNSDTDITIPLHRQGPELCR
jgi:hypothetical protein